MDELTVIQSTTYLNELYERFRGSDKGDYERHEKKLLEAIYLVRALADSNKELYSKLKDQQRRAAEAQLKVRVLKKELEKRLPENIG